MLRLINNAGSRLTTVMVVGALSSLFVGCNDDLYAPCPLDPASPDRAVAECGANDDIGARSCVVDNQVANCDTGACGRYQGSEPFCTKQCTTDDDCDGGRCVEFVFQSQRNYCVQQELL